MEERLLIGRDLHKPVNCGKCGEALVYLGIGEYECPSCHFLEYDDYGKVRNYLERYRGATQAEVAKSTGVSTSIIRQFLKEEKIEISPNSAVFMYCELCGKAIRSGRFCAGCATKGNSLGDALKSSNRNNIQGFGKESMDVSGAKRFQR